MNRLYAIYYKDCCLYYLRLIGEYAKCNKDNLTIIGIDQHKYQDINQLEAELLKLDIPILRLEFIDDFIEYTIYLNWNKYRPEIN